ncbi:WD40/YVTN/BNR-like repeat-containing protein [Gemmatimonadota bacterium]
MTTISRGQRLMLAMALLLCFSVIPFQSLSAQQVPQSILDGISYREIGPTRQSGRFVDFAVPLQDKNTFYAASASGGLWKTVNGGQSFTSLLDDYEIISIGDITVAPSNPDILYLGTGEGNNSRSVYYGNGVWKSTDAGETWTHMGLPMSQHIGRIVIHPTNPDIVYVASLGPLYSESDEAGLFKSTNGGRSWTKSLSVSSEGRSIGVVDVVMDPRRSNTLYAAAYDKTRRPWTFNEGGPGSGIYKTTNGGQSWTPLAGGLPDGLIGRIGLTISPQNSSILYAIIENTNIEDVDFDTRRQELLEGRPPSGRTIGNEVYRTDNAGRAWRKVNETGSVGGNPPYYYGQIIIDPNDSDHVYNLGVGVTESVDGGKTWRGARIRGGDNHALWIDPDDSDHMFLGHDHGMAITFDAGTTQYHPDNLSLAQLYAIGYDMAWPYNVYGGLQDNGSHGGPNTNPASRSIRFEDWRSVGGGDGMYNEVDPSNNRYLYNESQFGPIRRLDMVTGDSRSIRNADPDREYRYNWCAPILISPHNSDMIYHGANKVFRSSFRGEGWEVISPDLTTADSTKIVGTGNIQYCTITTMDESPIVPGLLWVGTDDGNVQMTKNGGEEWTLVGDNISGNPHYWVTRVSASPHDAGTAFVTFSGLRRDDFGAYVYKTTDYGETWTSLANNLPAESINVIRQDRKNPDLLFVGTDKQVHVTFDGGRVWHPLRNNMPYVAVHDLKIHPRENDLIVGTHGRGFFIADISALQELTLDVMGSNFHLCDIEHTVQWDRYANNATASTNWAGENAPTGVIINFFLKDDVEDATIRIYQGARLIKEIEADTTAGLNTEIWDMTGRVRERTEDERQQGRARQGQMGGGQFRGQASRGDPNWIEARIRPGEYRVELVVGIGTMTKMATILPDYWK